jgi:hypothetical protein
VDGLLHPFRTVTVFEGMQDAIPEEDRAEMTEQMEEMRRQMAAMEEQLEDMPPAQRRMVEQQLERMGGVEGLQARAEGQMGMLESGRMERVVRELRVNAGPPDPDAMSPIPGPGG